MLSKKGRGLRYFIAAAVLMVLPSLSGVVTMEPAVAQPKVPEPAVLKRVPLAAAKVRPPVKPMPTYAKFNPKGHDRLPVQDAPVSVTKDRARVRTINQTTARKAGVHGVLFTVHGTNGSGPVDVVVDPSTFRNAYGGDYASRLRLVRLPACALTSPDVAECQVQTPVATRPDAPLSANIALSRDDMAVLAATADASGPSGDYTATSLSPGGSWSVTGNTGAFTYSYPIAVPPPIGGAAPSLSLSYNSAAQDARTFGTNNQSSWIGDGWTTGESFIERSYDACADVKNSGAPEHDADVCWGGQRLTMSLNGASSPLVYDAVRNTLRPANDDATTKVEVLTGAANGTKNGEYFRLTENGVQYYFGLNRLPGWTANAEETKSAWTLPVYRAHSDVAECPDGSFVETRCTLGYRFNLDYVVDTRGNATAYYYAPEIGYYGAAMKNTAVEYVRGGTLKRIDYGMTASTVFGTTAPEQIVFTTAARCLVDDCGDDRPVNWPDVPVDLECTSGKDCLNHAPSFWSRRRLASILTKVKVDGQMKEVDRYDLVQSFPDNGDHAPTLWLESIQHTGLNLLGGATADTTTPAVTFLPVQLPNRVRDNMRKLYYSRIETVFSESGAETSVEYTTPDCSALPSDPSTNDTACFPIYWTPEGQPEPLLDWFYTHPVRRVTTLDRYNAYQDGSQPKLVTEYAYKGKPAWHYDDNEIVRAKYRTWGQFRGYPEVHVMTGDPSVFHNTDGTKVHDQKTLTKIYYFLGMDGDTLPGGKTRSVPPLTSQDGSVSVPDKDVYAGRVFETNVYTGIDGVVSQVTITVPTSIGPTASRTRNGLPPLTAQMVRTAQVINRQAVSYGWRVTETSTFYNTTTGQSTTGMPTQVADRGEIGAAGNQPTCTFMRYLDGKVSTLVVSAETIVTAQDCPTSGATPTGTLLSDIRTSYDSNAFAYNGDGQAAPVRPAIGNATLIQKAKTASGATATAFIDDTAQTYDAYGRVTSVKRIAQNTYKTITPAAGALPTSIATVTQVAPGADCATVTESSPSCHRETLALDTARQVATEKTAADGSRNSLTYDAMGRLTAVWLPNKVRAAGALPNITYEYRLSRTGPSVVTTNTLLEDGSYAMTKVLSDAMMRILEKQQIGENNSVTVNNTQYDSHGWTVLTNNSYATSGVPRDALISDQVSQVSIPSSTVTDHDAMGRPTQVTTQHNGKKLWFSRTAHTGDSMTVLPPTGSVSTTTTIDGRGRTTMLAQYTTAPTMSGSVTGGFTATGGTTQAIGYTYTPAGQQASVIGPDKAVWAFEYDLLGRQTKRTDPDTGTSSTTYDDAGNIATTKDARNVQLGFTYDLLGRKLTAIDKSKENFQYASWEYDTLRIGKPTSSNRYVKGVTGPYTVAITEYSSLGKPLGQTISLPSAEQPLPPTYTTKFAYTPNVGLLAQQQDPAVGSLPGETINYGYNTLGAATRTEGIDIYIGSTVYTEYGQYSRVTMGASTNEAEAIYAYDEATLRLSGRTVSRAQAPGPVVDELSYTYDAAGNALSVTDKQSETGITITDAQCYQYDGLARLVDARTVTGPCSGPLATGPGSYRQTFDYNAIGNRKQSVEHSTNGGADVTRTYQNGCLANCNRTGAQPHTLTATTGGADPTTMVYDVAGNLLTRTGVGGNGQKLKWDDEGHLAEVAAVGTTAATTQYLYDADGNQLIRRDPGRTTLFAGDTQIVIDTTVKPGVVIGAVRSYAHGGTGAAVAVRSTLPGGGVHYLFNDPHGTATLAMDATTHKVSRQQYKPYGETRASTNTTLWPDPTRGYLAAPKDLTTGYTDLGARKYDPALGRFISPDPLLETADPNQLGGYTYAGDNPITGADPSGMIRQTELGGWTPLTQPDPTTVVDQNGVPHRLREPGDKRATAEDRGTVSYLNRHLQSAGELYDASTGNGSQFFLQNEDNPIVPKGVIELDGGGKTVTGTTADAIKVSWINGKRVSVDTYDFTEGKADKNEHNVRTVQNKLATEVVDNRKPKMQAQFVVFVAQDDAQAVDMRARLRNVGNSRVVNLASGFDSGEMYSETHWNALKAAGLSAARPRTQIGEVEGRSSGGGRIARGGGAGLGALSVVGDLYLALKFGQAYASEDPLALHRFACDFTMGTGPSCIRVSDSRYPYTS